MDTNKLVALLKSRKFWATLIGLITIMGYGNYHGVPPEKIVDAIMVLVGIFTGSVAVEDGLSNMNKPADEQK